MTNTSYTPPLRPLKTSRDNVGKFEVMVAGRITAHDDLEAAALDAQERNGTLYRVVADPHAANGFRRIPVPVAMTRTNREILHDAGCETFAEERARRRQALRDAEAERRGNEFFRVVSCSVREIKPCPWCGSPGRYSRDGVCHRIVCKSDDCPVKPSIELDLAHSTISELLTAWNTRTAS
jgi:hypothetical protein